MVNKKNEGIINSIAPEDAIFILKQVVKEYPNVNIGKIIKGHLDEENPKKVNIDEVAQSVFDGLEFLEVEDLWDSSGGTRYGYVEPGERADEMIEEVLKPYFEELERYAKLSMFSEAKSYCKGILKGVYQFDDESSTEFSDWATDTAYNFIPVIFDKWKKICKNKTDIKDVKEYMTKVLGFKMPKF